jgi:hypothetical protein
MVLVVDRPSLLGNNECVDTIPEKESCIATVERRTPAQVGIGYVENVRTSTGNTFHECNFEQYYL